MSTAQTAQHHVNGTECTASSVEQLLDNERKFFHKSVHTIM